MMKEVRNFVYALATTVILILLWCTVSLKEISAVEFAVRGVISLLILYLGVFRTKPVEERLRKVARIAADTVASAINNVLERWQDVTVRFVQWCCEASIDEIIAARDEIEGRCNPYLESKEERRLERPIRLIARWQDFMSACALVAFVTGAGLAVHYKSILLVVLLNLLSLMFIFFSWNIVISATFFDNNKIISTDPFMVYLCVIVQVLVLLAQLAVVITKVCSGSEIESGVLYDPYFRVQLGTQNIGISPLQMVIIISTVLALVGFANVCTSVHELVELAAKGETKEE